MRMCAKAEMSTKVGEGPTNEPEASFDTDVLVRGRSVQVSVDRSRARHGTTVKWSYTVSRVETDTREGVGERTRLCITGGWMYGE